MAQVRNRPPGSSWRVVFIGQSWLNSPSPYTGGPESIPAVSMSGRGIPWENLAINGVGWAAWLAALMQDVYDQVVPTTANNVLVMYDSGQSSAWSGATAATIYAEQVDIAEAAKNIGGYTHVIGSTLTGNAANTSPQNTKRLDLNTLMLANADGAFDAVVDVNVGPVADWTDPTYYFEDHPNAAGCAALAALLIPTLDAILV